MAVPDNDRLAAKRLVFKSCDTIAHCDDGGSLLDYPRLKAPIEGDDPAASEA
jgi:hypothetical protein